MIFGITRLSARKSEQMKNAYIYRLNTKIRLTMLRLSSFELYSRWVHLIIAQLVFVNRI